MAGFKCRCEYIFCSLHRHSDKHNCTFDYKAHSRAELTKANPTVVADKIEKVIYFFPAVANLFTFLRFEVYKNTKLYHGTLFEIKMHIAFRFQFQKNFETFIPRSGVHLAV